MILVEANREGAYEILHTLNQYTEIPSQRINILKSGIIFNKNNHHSVGTDLAAILNLELWDSPRKYLGLPSDWSRDLMCFNTTLLAKQAWRATFNPQALWVKVLKGIYFPNSCLWEARKSRNISWSWRSLLEGRDLLAWLIGNGASISVYGDRWVGAKAKLWGNSSRHNVATVKDLFEEGKFWWNVAKVRSMFDSESAQAILATPIMGVDEDRRIWPFTIDGQYYVKTGYKCALSELRAASASSNKSSGSGERVWESLWKANVAPKIKDFIWRIFRNALPSNHNLARRNMHVDPIYPLCKAYEETTEHLLFRCEKASQVWFGSPFLWDARLAPQLSTIDTITLIIKNAAEMFNGYSFNPQDVLIKASMEACEFLNSSLQRDGPGAHVNLRRDRPKWCPPSEDSVKFNVDAATDLTNFKALKVASSLGFSSIIIESDSKVVIDFCSGQLDSWLLESILSHVLISLPPNIAICFSNVPRTCNSAADFLAKGSLNSSLSYSWVWLPLLSFVP
ncbi:reverse transcriptase [Senna tora]|uniref:Reverse transcriptase n=1 Tax=Senna tora TaxID=362788 RepID=A0A834T2I7_9FABA|nr:reverse transcriptase [Senna tora]